MVRTLLGVQSSLSNAAIRDGPVLMSRTSSRASVIGRESRLSTMIILPPNMSGKKISYTEISKFNEVENNTPRKSSS